MWSGSVGVVGIGVMGGGMMKVWLKVLISGFVSVCVGKVNVVLIVVLFLRRFCLFILFDIVGDI